MADPKSQSSPVPSPSARPTPGTIRYENRTRTAWVVEHPDGDLVFGQSVDRDIPDAERDPVHQRSPIVSLDREREARLPEHSRRFLDGLVAKGLVDRREAA